MSSDRMELKRADYSHWNYAVFITLNEFIYLADGYEPLHIGAHGNAYLNLSSSEFKDFYKRVNRVGEELPIKSTLETEVKCFLTPEPKYEATFLLKWARSKNISVNPKYCPVESEERKNKQFIRNFIGRQVISRNEFVQILVKYNADRDAQYFHDMLFDAVKAQLTLKIIPKPRNVYKDDPSNFNYDFTSDSLFEYAIQMGWELPEVLKPKNKPEMNLRNHFKDGEIMVDGIIDVREIKSTKLVLALENYIINMRQDPKKIPSTDSVKKELVSNYGQDGVTEAMARIIDECSRHDTRANNPPKSARKKTIFFQ